MANPTPITPAYQLFSNAARRRAQLADRLVAALAYTAVLSVTAVFLWILFDIISHGAPQLSWAFLTTAPQSFGRAGGIGPIIVSTALILAVCLAAAFPIGTATALLLAEFTPTHNLFGRLIRRSLDVLAGVPSIVFGLFGNAFFCVYLNLGFSILSGGLTLACMVLPIYIRAAEEGLRSVPDEHRLAAAALGLSRTSTITRIVLPLAMPGLMVGIVLGVGRALAETAALLFTSGYVDRMPQSLHDSGRALSIHIFDLSMNVAGGDPNAYASALVLITLLLAINLTASLIASRFLKARGVLPI